MTTMLIAQAKLYERRSSFLFFPLKLKIRTTRLRAEYDKIIGAA